MSVPNLVSTGGSIQDRFQDARAFVKKRNASETGADGAVSGKFLTRCAQKLRNFLAHDAVKVFASFFMWLGAISMALGGIGLPILLVGIGLACLSTFCSALKENARSESTAKSVRIDVAASVLLSSVVGAPGAIVVMALGCR